MIVQPAPAAVLPGEKDIAMDTHEPIRVMIVDDHSMVRRGLASILRVRPGLQLVGEASNGQEALQLCDQLHPDVILMDLVMPEMDGAAATRAVRERFPEIQVIALTSFKEKELVQGALEAGAIGYLLKNISSDELADAIYAAYAGRPTLAPEVAQILLQAEKLEQLARTLIDAPADPAALPTLLAEHVPPMFPGCQVQIHLFPNQTLLRFPKDSPSIERPLWEWLQSSNESHCFLPGARLPWGDVQASDLGVITCPLNTADSMAPIGGIMVARQQDPGSIADLLPTVRSLAAQVVSAFQSAQFHAQTQAHEKVARELAMAGQIQASFLPNQLPQLPGWQLGATLEPARETSGDFYDFIPLPNQHLGIVMADVADKGVGAALYMALSRTLIRTYAAEYLTRPDLVLSATNHRMLVDTRAGLFVTAFYGILDPATGNLIYCNAGHNPPLLLNAQDRAASQSLGKTGMALGAVDDASWERGQVRIEPNDVLILYTDGITDAQNDQGEFYGNKRLHDFLHGTVPRQVTHRNLSMVIQEALLSEVQQFMGDTLQYDDMTLMILVREPQ
jgi:serine phosphatase RsbU (regulator of sigma subunit)/DNA-binding NarL/FixJ family response regulator